MTKNGTKSILSDFIDNFLIEVSGTTDLTQTQLDALTDGLADALGDTVNPNGPCYPSTPR